MPIFKFVISNHHLSSFHLTCFSTFPSLPKPSLKPSYSQSSPPHPATQPQSQPTTPNPPPSSPRPAAMRKLQPWLPPSKAPGEQSTRSSKSPSCAPHSQSSPIPGALPLAARASLNPARQSVAFLALFCRVGMLAIGRDK